MRVCVIYGSVRKKQTISIWNLNTEPYSVLPARNTWSQSQAVWGNWKQLPVINWHAHTYTDFDTASKVNRDSERERQFSAFDSVGGNQSARHTGSKSEVKKANLDNHLNKMQVNVRYRLIEQLKEKGKRVSMCQVGQVSRITHCWLIEIVYVAHM